MLRLCSSNCFNNVQLYFVCIAICNVATQIKDGKGHVAYAGYQRFIFKSKQSETREVMQLKQCKAKEYLRCITTRNDTDVISV